MKTENNHHTGKCVPCNSTRYLCYQQLISTATFKSNQTDKKFKIYHRVNWKRSFVNYLLKCYICSIQYVGKSETPFNISLNNHRKDVKNLNAIPPCKHFNKHVHEFKTFNERLKHRENFWIMKLDTLAPLGLNPDLNWIHFMQTFHSPPLFFVSACGLK